MTINAPATVLLALYSLVGEEQGCSLAELSGTTQNDVLKEYIARGNFIYPPEGTMRLTTDLFAYCKEFVPRWNTISISGYHFREKGCSAVQEVAFTMCSAIAYVQAAIDAGLEVDEFAPRLAFFFNGHNNVFQEVAKFRAARRMWAHIMRDRFGAKNPKSMTLRFHTQTGGVTLTAQQPQNNVTRVALQGFAAVCGGTQSLHTNGYDEALALPSERAAKIALRTQQIIAHESGATDTVDPFAGSYYVEALTSEIEERAYELIAKVDEMGGSVNAIEFITNEIDESAWGYQERYRLKQDIVVGVNKYEEDQIEIEDILRVDPATEKAQLDRLAAFKRDRDHELVRAAARRAARGGPRHGQPHAPDPPGAEGPLLDGRGLRRDEGRLRGLPAAGVGGATVGDTAPRCASAPDDPFAVGGAIVLVDVDGVEAGAAVDRRRALGVGVDRVVAGTGVDAVGAAAAQADLVVAVAAVDRVAPGAALQVVVAVLAADRVASRAAVDRVAAGTAEEAVERAAGVAVELVAPDHVAAAEAVDDVRRRCCRAACRRGSCRASSRRRAGRAR